MLISDTIAAVSSPTNDQRVIVRITGPETADILKQIFTPTIPCDKAGIISGNITIDEGLKLDATLYLFLAPHSYTGQTLAEIHLYTNQAVVQALMESLFAKRVRMAGAGEFTARAYLNGKIDLTQAEAVNEIITSSNELQLAAAEKLLAGRLTETAIQICSELMDCLSLIEAGMDFSGEDIEFISDADAVGRLKGIKNKLQRLLSENSTFESVVDLPAVGIAGVPNAGKSSLLNKLLGKKRSLVSEQPKTTRDILTGILTLAKNRCVLFDCAGLIQKGENILDELAQKAAVEAINAASVVIFCVDIAKKDWKADAAIFELIKPKALIAAATKADLLKERQLHHRLLQLNEIFAADFLAISAKSGSGLAALKNTIDAKLIEFAGVKYDTSHGVALTARHRQAVTEAIENINEAIKEISAGGSEVAAMMMRAAYYCVSNIGQQSIDEKILDNIFSKFCIGK
jgi:tRNA modification GTPase